MTNRDYTISPIDDDKNCSKSDLLDKFENDKLIFLDEIIQEYSNFSSFWGNKFENNDNMSVEDLTINLTSIGMEILQASSCFACVSHVEMIKKVIEEYKESGIEKKHILEMQKSFLIHINALIKHFKEKATMKFQEIIKEMK